MSAFETEVNPEGKVRVSTVRPLHVIARSIRQHWKPVNYAAKPYLDAMGSLGSINDNYMEDGGRSVVGYFLSNATTWRGEAARLIKAELKAMLKAR